MKKLYIISTIIKDWFTTRLLYTAAVLCVFILSFIALFFVTTKVSAEYLTDSKTENIYYNELRINEETVPDACEKEFFLLDDSFYSEYLKIGLPPLSDNCYVDGWLKYSERNGEKLNGTDFCELRCFPFFSETDNKRYNAIKNLLNYEYEITEGRDLEESDCRSGMWAAVAPEGYALEVGDVISCFGHKLEIVGLNKPSPHNLRDYEQIVVPYGFLLECMGDGLSEEAALELIFDEAYGKKPENNAYVPSDNEEPQYYYGQTPFGDERVYPAFLRLSVNSFMFEKKVTDAQKEGLAKFLGITAEDFTNDYDRYYHYDVEKFNKQAFKECIIAGIFCILNAFMLVVFLSVQNSKAYRIYRVYGCSAVNVFVINFLSLMAVVIIALVASVLLCRPAMQLFSYVNAGYEFRPRCVMITAEVFVAVSAAACVPAAVSAVRKSPVGK